MEMEQLEIYAGTSAHVNGYNDSSANDMSIG